MRFSCVGMGSVNIEMKYIMHEYIKKKNNNNARHAKIYCILCVCVSVRACVYYTLLSFSYIFYVSMHVYLYHISLVYLNAQSDNLHPPPLPTFPSKPATETVATSIHPIIRSHLFKYYIDKAQNSIMYMKRCSLSLA